MDMVFRWPKYIAILVAVGFCTTGPVNGGPLNLKVVYPKPDQNLPAVDSTFIFGSVEPGAGLIINGQVVNVHKDGGWLAFLPVCAGEFEFNLRAYKEKVSDTLTLRIYLPELPRYELDSLYFLPATFLPAETTWVRPGDRLELGFRSLPYCNGLCIVQPFGDTVILKELPPRSYYISRNVFDSNLDFDTTVPESLLIRGDYRGSYTIPATDVDSLGLVYQVYPPSSEQIIWMTEHGDQIHAPSMLPFHKLMALKPIPPDTADIPVRILDEGLLPVIELTDTLTVIRTGPGKGYLCIHQPAGIRAEVAGKAGPWLKLKLSNYQYGWVPDTALTFLSPGSRVPHSYVRKIQTVSSDDRVSVRIDTQGRHPFRVLENTEERSLTVYVFGAEADTDWIRYDTLDRLIDHIVWFQDEPGLFGVKIYLNSDRIWGYDAYYDRNELHFDIIKIPEEAWRFSQYRFVIDPGHSPDPGAIGPTGLTEAMANLNIARRLARALRHKGAEVILTRDDDSPLPLYDRPKIAVREKADIFISIHNNALPVGTNPFINNGVSTYYYHPHSEPLARAVQKSLAKHTGLNDFGLYYGNLAVNRPTQYPAILVECTFIIIPEQEALLKTKWYPERVARAVVEGIEDFLHENR